MANAKTPRIDTQIETAIRARSTATSRERSNAREFRTTRFIEAAVALFDAGGSAEEMAAIIKSISTKHGAA